MIFGNAHRSRNLRQLLEVHRLLISVVDDELLLFRLGLSWLREGQLLGLGQMSVGPGSLRDPLGVKVDGGLPHGHVMRNPVFLVSHGSFILSVGVIALDLLVVHLLQVFQLGVKMIHAGVLCTLVARDLARNVRSILCASVLA